MILTMNNEELNLLLISMKTTRKNVKKGFKKTYKKGHKEVMNAYDWVIDVMSESLEKDRDMYDLNVTIDDLNMVDSFCSFYLSECQKLSKINPEFKKDLDILDAIRTRSIGLKLEQGLVSV